MMRRMGQLASLGILAATALTACVSAPQPSRPEPVRPVIRPAKPVPPAIRPSPPVAVPPGVAASRPPAGLDRMLFELWRGFPGKTGIAVRRIDGDWALAQRGGDLFPQQSVSKLWVTMTVLDQVDRGKLRLSDKVRIGPNDLTLFHQPIADRVRADGEVTETISSLIEQAMTKSDNSANDALLRTAGGPAAVRAFMRDKNLGSIRFGPGERLLQSRIAGMTWDQSYSVGRSFQTARAAVPADQRNSAMAAYLADPMDGASPDALALALARLARGDLLSDAMTTYLIRTMERSTSGPKRLKGGLPYGWTIAHKTGTGQELNGVSTGYNDIGIVTAPDGTRYAVVVMLGDTTASVPQRMELMQAVTRTVASMHGQ